MKTCYLKFVEWSEEDRLFIGYCPDLFIGGVCHGKKEESVYTDLCRLVDEEITTRKKNRSVLPIRQAIVAQRVVV
jgi:hypothetical protein